MSGLRFPAVPASIRRWATNALTVRLRQAGIPPAAPAPDIWSSELRRLLPKESRTHAAKRVVAAMSQAFADVGLPLTHGWQRPFERYLESQEPTPFVGCEHLVREALCQAIDANLLPAGLSLADLAPATEVGRVALDPTEPGMGCVLAAAVGGMEGGASTVREWLALGARPAPASGYGPSALGTAASEWMDDELGVLLDVAGPPPAELLDLLRQAVEGRLGYDLDGSPLPVRPSRRESQRRCVQSLGRRLRDLQADLNAPHEDDGDCVIHVAARCAPPAVVRLLLHYGASPQARTLLGESPSDLAADESVRRVIESYASGTPLPPLDADEAPGAPAYAEDAALSP